MGMDGPPFTWRRAFPLVKREKTSSHLRSREDRRFHATPPRNAAVNVARVRVALLPSTAGTSRVPQLGGAAASACSVVVRGRRPVKSAAGPREVSSQFLSPVPRDTFEETSRGPAADFTGK